METNKPTNKNPAAYSRFCLPYDLLTTDLTFWAQGSVANFISDPLFYHSDQLRFWCYEVPRLSARRCAYLPRSWRELLSAHYTAGSPADMSTQPGRQPGRLKPLLTTAFASELCLQLPARWNHLLHPTKPSFLVFIMRLCKDQATWESFPWILAWVASPPESP